MRNVAVWENPTHSIQGLCVVPKILICTLKKRESEKEKKGK